MNHQDNVAIVVQTQYLQAAMPEKDKYPFSYTITITNKTSQQVQLVNRYWLVTDGNGKRTEVRGAGVVGKQPYIKTGESFKYSSGAILNTPVGTMQGYYEMRGENGEIFQAPIEVFSLAVPNALN